MQQEGMDGSASYHHVIFKGTVQGDGSGNHAIEKGRRKKTKRGGKDVDDEDENENEEDDKRRRRRTRRRRSRRRMSMRTRTRTRARTRTRNCR